MFTDYNKYKEEICNELKRKIQYEFSDSEDYANYSLSSSPILFIDIAFDDDDDEIIENSIEKIHEENKEKNLPSFFDYGIYMNISDFAKDPKVYLSRFFEGLIDRLEYESSQNSNNKPKVLLYNNFSHILEKLMLLPVISILR